MIFLLTNNRDFHFIGTLTLRKSRALKDQTQPKDDEVNWLFLKIGEKQLSFVYKIQTPLAAKYNKPFEAQISFTMSEVAIKVIKLHERYEVLRGQEVIGTISLDKFLD